MHVRLVEPMRIKDGHRPPVTLDTNRTYWAGEADNGHVAIRHRGKWIGLCRGEYIPVQEKKKQHVQRRF